VDMFWAHSGEHLHADTIMSACSNFFLLDSFSSLEDWFKFQTTYISAVLLRQSDLPSRPTWIPLSAEGIICGGRFHRLVRAYELRAICGEKLRQCVCSFAFGVL
jgi:hypothetical protein